MMRGAKAEPDTNHSRVTKTRGAAAYLAIYRRLCFPPVSSFSVHASASQPKSLSLSLSIGSDKSGESRSSLHEGTWFLPRIGKIAAERLVSRVWEKPACARARARVEAKSSPERACLSVCIRDD